eukprot:s2960_g10.t1
MEPFGEDRRKRSILNLDAFADSSWGDCHSSRRSTSSSTIFLNGAYVLSFSRTQATVALSSCEADAANAAIAEGLFLGRLCEFLVAEVKDGPTEHVSIRLFSDSSAAIGTIQRRGVGRMKHIEIRHLFLQELLRKKVLTASKIGTKQNPADLGTKKLGMDRRKELFQLIGICMPGVCESDQGFERKQMKKIQNVIARVLQATALTMLQGCSPDLSGFENIEGKPTTTASTSWTSSTWILYVVFIVIFLVFIYIVGAMVPSGNRGQGGRSSSSSRRPLVPDSEEEAQAIQLHKILAVMFLMAAKMRHLGLEDDVNVHRVYYDLKLAENLLLQGERQVAQSFLDATGSAGGFENEAVLAEVARMEELLRLPFDDLDGYEQWFFSHFHLQCLEEIQRDSESFGEIFEHLDELYQQPQGHAGPRLEDVTFPVEEKVENPSILRMMKATTMMELMLDVKRVRPERVLRLPHFQMFEVAKGTQKMQIRTTLRTWTCSESWMSRAEVYRGLCKFLGCGMTMLCCKDE